MNRTDALAPLRERNFRWYFFAQLVHRAGGTMASVALAFAVLEIDDSPTALGTVLAANSIPMVAFLLAGGVIADRFDRARVMRVCNLVAGLSQAAVAALVITGTAELWQLMVLVAINGVVFAVSVPAMAAVVPQLVPRELLQPANVLLSMVRGGLTVVGPTIAAVLVVTVGPGWALAADAACWLLAAALLLQVRIPARPPAPRSSMFAELREGWAIFAGTTWLWVVVLAFSMLNVIHSGAWYTLGPPLAKDTIGASGWGFVLSAEAVGLLVMTVLLLRMRFRRPLRAGMLGCALFALPLVTLGARPELVTLVVAAFIAGMGLEIFNLTWNLTMQENIDEEVLSRAYAFDSLGSFVAIPVGQLAFGPLGAAFGLQKVLVVAGLVYAAIALFTLASKDVRNLTRRVSTTSVPVS